ncbi:GFA family protein [Vibrio chagasii]|uniref:GFA family protein n=1 Tax=Vibrio chagasii TaxID=170679 RepID=UPI000CF433A8
MYGGSCLCGTVKVEITGDIKSATHCHCNMCQKTHGAAFATFAASRDEDFMIVQGGTLLNATSHRQITFAHFARIVGQISNGYMILSRAMVGLHLPCLC